MKDYVPYTNRENELLKQFAAITDDYSDEEIVRVLGRRLLYMSFGPMQSPLSEGDREWAVVEGWKTMRFYREHGLPFALALVLAAGILTALAAELPAETEPSEC